MSDVPGPPAGGPSPPPSPPSPPPPPSGAQAPVYQGSDNTFGGLIPTKNPSALSAYYLGIAALIPLIGIFTGIAAFILGIKGVRFAKAHPEAKGAIHAWVGVILGGIFGALYLFIFGGIFIGALMN